MMKFILKQVKNGCRRGMLTEVSAENSDAIETPICMQYTRAGSVPYLCREVLDRIEGLPKMVNMPLALLAENHETLEAYQKGIKHFSALPDCVAYCSLHDPAVENPSGYNENNTSSIWGRGGKYKLDIALYMRVVEAMKADWCQALCDSDTDIESTRKRVIKSVNRNLNYLDSILERHGKSERLQDTGIIGVIAGGHMVAERERSAKETAQRPVAGFTIEGFHNFGPETEKFRLGDVKDLLQKTLEHLPEDKPRILPGIQTPENVLMAVELGFDIFDSSYPYIVTERGSALVFSFKPPPPGVSMEESGSSQETTEKSWEISLKDKRFHDDLNPVLKGCTCYCCTHHTRAYINHLLTVSEILGSVLLMIHNLHHYFRFFEEIRNSISTGSFDQLKELVIEQKPS